MTASESRNLPAVLEMTEAVYRGTAGQLSPPGRDRLAQRARHLAGCVRFGVDEPAAMRSLHELTGELHNAGGLASLLPRVLDGTLALMGADFGTLQLLDPVTGSLRLVTQSGFGPEFVEYFAMVDDQHSACARAAHSGAHAVIADVNADPMFAPHRGIAAAASVRAVQSTPLADYAGRLIGVVSTHFARPYGPPARELRLMELYGNVAGEAIARRLGVTAGDSTGDAVGRAVLAALLGAGEDQAADPAILSRHAAPALRARMVQRARALQARAEEAARLLEQQADRARQPQRTDYVTEIKRWRTFADQARQMAERWEPQR